METLLALLLGLALATVFLLFAHSRVGGERRVLAVGLVAAALIYVALAAGPAPVIWLGVAAYAAARAGATITPAPEHSRNR